jgi:spore germination cell wall hydrolase CwlJ-like protein
MMMEHNEKPLLVVIAVLAAVALFVVHAKEADGETIAWEDVNAGATIETFLEHASTQPVEEVITGTAEVPEDTEVTAVTYEVTEEDTPEQIAEEEYYDTLDLLALCVEAEAGDQDLYGKRLVVDVVLNRVDSPDFPDTIAEVITQVRQFATY